MTTCCQVVVEFVVKLLSSCCQVVVKFVVNVLSKCCQALSTLCDFWETQYTHYIRALYTRCPHPSIDGGRPPECECATSEHAARNHPFPSMAVDRPNHANVQLPSNHLANTPFHRWRSTAQIMQMHNSRVMRIRNFRARP